MLPIGRQADPAPEPPRVPEPPAPTPLALHRARRASADREQVLTTLLQVSHLVARADSDGIDAAVTRALEVLVDGLDLERAQVIRIDPVAEVSWLEHSRVRADVRSAFDHREALPISAIPRVAAAVLAEEVLEVPDVARLDDTWGQERAATLARGVRAFALYPFRMGETQLGALVLDCTRPRVDWSDHRAGLQLAVGILETAYARRRAQAALEHRRALERSVIRLVHRLLAQGPARFHADLPTTLAHLGDVFGLASVGVWAGEGAEETRRSVLGWWSAPGGPPAPPPARWSAIDDVVRVAADRAHLEPVPVEPSVLGAEPDAVALAVPLVHRLEVVGLLLVVGSEPDRLGPADLDALGLVAEAVAGALALARADADLRASEERFRLLAAHTPDLLLRVDVRGVITYTSDAVSRLLGFEPSDLLGRPLRDVVVPDDVATLAAVAARVRSGVVVEGVELRLRRAGDEVVWVEANAAGVFEGDRLVAVQTTLRDLRHRRAALERLEHLARHDALTDLLNRRAFIEDADTVLLHDPACLVFVDLDGFKEINDRFGHAEGDELLVTVARRLRSAVRPADLVGRLGGDEFVMLLRSTGRAAAAVVASRLLEMLAAPVVLHAGTVEVGASIGVVSAMPGDRAQDALARADAAMYRAKRSGRNRVVEA